MRLPSVGALGGSSAGSSYRHEADSRLSQRQAPSGTRVALWRHDGDVQLARQAPSSRLFDKISHGPGLSQPSF